MGDEVGSLLPSVAVIVILMCDATNVEDKTIVLSSGIPNSPIRLKLSQLNDAEIRTLSTCRNTCVPMADGVPILILVIRATPPRLKIKYSGQPGPSRSAGDQTALDDSFKTRNILIQ